MIVASPQETRFIYPPSGGNRNRDNCGEHSKVVAVPVRNVGTMRDYRTAGWVGDAAKARAQH
jgi:hypothetical protein